MPVRSHPDQKRERRGEILTHLYLENLTNFDTCCYLSLLTSSSSSAKQKDSYQVSWRPGKWQQEQFFLSTWQMRTTTQRRAWNLKRSEVQIFCQLQFFASKKQKCWKSSKQESEQIFLSQRNLVAKLTSSSKGVAKKPLQLYCLELHDSKKKVIWTANKY